MRLFGGDVERRLRRACLLGGDAGILGVVANEVRQRVAVGDAVAIILHPVFPDFVTEKQSIL